MVRCDKLIPSREPKVSWTGVPVQLTFGSLGGINLYQYVCLDDTTTSSTSGHIFPCICLPHPPAPLIALDLPNRISVTGSYCQSTGNPVLRLRHCTSFDADNKFTCTDSPNYNGTQLLAITHTLLFVAEWKNDNNKKRFPQIWVIPPAESGPSCPSEWTALTGWYSWLGLSWFLTLSQRRRTWVFYLGEHELSFSPDCLDNTLYCVLGYDTMDTTFAFSCSLVVAQPSELSALRFQPSGSSVPTILYF